MTLPVVASLWIGGNLSYLEQLCLKSFADHGHRTLLYTYETVDNCPEGVELLDANRIFPATEFIKHKNSGSPAVHADAFRYRMIALQNVIWVDADILCMQPWTFEDQFVFGWEKPGKLVCNAVFGLPRFSKTLTKLNALCATEYPIPPWASGEELDRLTQARDRGQPVHVSEMTWGVWGPAAVTHFLNETGEIAHARPQEAFYPVSFKHRRRLLRPGAQVEDTLLDGCYAVHLWNRRLHRRIITHENGIPHKDSFLGRALQRHGVDPHAAPIPDRPPEGHPTQAELKARTRAPAPAAETVPVPKRATSRQSAPYQRAIDNLETRTSTLADRLPPPATPLSHDNILVLTSMKNEAPFILEWIAYHKAIGATHFLVYTNDCTDNTNAILDRLSELGHVTRLDNPWRAGSDKKPQHVALQDALSQPRVKEAGWVLTIDVDEFVNIHVGDGTFASLFDAAGDPNVISFTWKFFGNAGIDAYEDRPIIEQFTRCAPEFIPKPRLGWGFKSMIHRSAPYTKIGVHRPLKIADESDVDKVRWVNGSGRVMPDMLLTNNGWRSTKRSLGYQLATLNHYVLRSADSFLVKRERGRINHTDQDQGIDYWMRRNYTSEEDTRLRDRLPMMETVRKALMQDETLAQLHAEAVAWHRARIDTLKADDAYAALYRDLTTVPRPDAIYLTKSDGEAADQDPNTTGVAIPEPEREQMTEAEASEKLRQLRALLSGTPTPAAPPAPSEPQVTGPSHDVTCPAGPSSALSGPANPQFDDARAHAARTGGFFWEGPANALMFEPRSRNLVVTFDNILTAREDGPRWPWGYRFVADTLGSSVLGVMATQRNWFRHDFVHDAFDQLRDTGFFDQFDSVLFYGTSMGGFGALTYARCCPGARVFAVAPQATHDPARFPNDDRWRWRRKLDWRGRYADASADTATAEEIVILYDPYFALDRDQVDQFKGANIRKLRMPFFGHQIPNALAVMEILKPILNHMSQGTLSDALFYRLMRARRDLPRYQHDLLMQAEARGHQKLAIQVCEYTLRKRKARNIRKSLERLRAEVYEDQA